MALRTRRLPHLQLQRAQPRAHVGGDEVMVWRDRRAHGLGVYLWERLQPPALRLLDAEPALAVETAPTTGQWAVTGTLRSTAAHPASVEATAASPPHNTTQR